jgi:uncharacterized protein (TIGR03435 family)
MKTTLALIVATRAFSQPLPTFDAASVRVALPAMNVIGYNTIPGNVSYRNVSMKSLLAEAFIVKEYQVSGPAWLEQDATRYVIQAKCPRNTSQDAVRQMLQSLLEQKFKLAVHREKKEIPVYVLSIDADGLKLKKTPGETAGGFSGASTWPGNVIGDWSVSDFAEMLAPHLQRPVLDETGLKGMFQIRLNWTPDGTSIFSSVRSQLGLKLVEKNAEIEFLVIDRLEKLPTAN